MSFRFRSKIIIGWLTLNLMIGIALFWLIRHEVHQRLEKETYKRGAAIARHLAETAVTPILGENLSSLQLMVNDTLKNEEDIRYIFIVNERKAVLAHTFGQVFPAELLDMLPLASQIDKGSIKLKHLQSETGLIYDMPAGIQQGLLGQVHIGFSENAINKTLNEVVRYLMLYLVGIVCLGTVMSIVLATAITRPIAVLAAGVKRIGRGEMDHVIDVGTKDEIGELADSFNTMVENLRLTTVSRQYMDKVINSMNDALIVYSENGEINAVNRAFGRLFGYLPNDLVGKTIENYQEQSAPRYIYDAFKLYFQDGIESHEGVCLRSTGERVSVLFSLAVMRDEQGRRHDVIGVVNDISAFKKAQEELEQKQAELERLNHNLEGMVASRTAELAITNEGLRAQISNSRRITAELEVARDAAEAASRAKSEFLTNMSHELRTPLNSIIGGTEFLEEADLNAEQNRCLDMIRQAGKNMLVMVNDLIDLARIETGHLEIISEEFSLQEMLEKTVEMLCRSARSKGLDLLLETTAELPSCVIGDRIRLQQVLVNLASNAVKFTSHGFVKIIVEPGAEQQGRVPITFVVRDTGIGIPADKLEEIFESFTQADTSITRRFGGSGLGLAISRRLVEAMGGTIHAESTIGVGSAFYVKMPMVCTFGKAAGVVREEGRGGTGQTNQPARDSDKPVVLLVDDSPENRELMRLLLVRKTVDIHEAGNGHQALEMFRENDYDLILMDIQMPVMDGYTATRQIRQLEERSGWRKTPIVALTAHAYDDDIRACREAGCDDHISKPFKKAALFGCFTKYLGGEFV